jgi:uncharacterized protein (TIGR02001 family)
MENDMKRSVIAVSLLVVCPVPVLAQDWVVYGGGEAELLFDPDGAGSGTEASLSSYIEAERAGFYAGLFAKYVDDTASNEVNLYAGYRRDLDSGLSYGLVYTRYIYPNDSASNYGELGLSLGQTIGEKAAVSFDAYYDHTNELGSAYVGAEFYATDKITLSANYGTYEVDAAPSEQEWDVGASYAFTDEAAVDVRYYDGTEYTDSYFGLSVTYDTTIFGG